MNTFKYAVSAMSISVLLSSIAGVNAEPSDKKLRLQLDSQTGSNIAATAIGLIPDPFGISTAAEITSLGLDISLRNHAAILKTPESKLVYANSPGANNSSNVNCVYSLGQDDYNADLSSIFFWQYQRPNDKWGLLGNPSVYHPNGEVKVSVSNPVLDNYVSRGVSPQFLPGEHEIEWLAESKFNYVTDAALPVALMASFAYAESKYARSLQARNTAKILNRSAGQISKEAAEKLTKEAADRAARYVFKLVGLASDLGLLSANIANADDAIKWLDETSVTSATRKRTQTLTVYDEHIPVFLDSVTGNIIQQQSIELEAEDFGGVRFGRVRSALAQRFSLFDRCEKNFNASTDANNSLLLKVDETTPVNWITLDNGPFPTDLQTNYPNQQISSNSAQTRLIQQVKVVDTQAPLLVAPSGYSVESSEPIDLTTDTFPLGRPRVADLADPAPSVNNNFDDLQELQTDMRYRVAWTATDASLNTSEVAFQTVTVKSPNTNTQPQAFNKSAETISEQMVEIILTGSDTDSLPIAGTEQFSTDPLEFRIEKYPEKGEFKAELYPYFIEDFRLSPVGDDEEIKRNQIVRTSPLKHLADEFRLLDERDRGPFLKSKICDAKSDASDPDELQNYQTFANKIPVEFAYNPLYVHVNDKGEYFILDHFFDCDVTQFDDTENLPWAGIAMPAIPRVSKWTRDREFVAMHELTALPNKTYANGSISEVVYPAQEFNYDKFGRVWFRLGEWYDHIEGQTRVVSFDSDLQNLTSHGVSEYVFFLFESSLKGIASDEERSLLYELHTFGLRVNPYGANVKIAPIPEFIDFDDPAICQEFTCINGSDVEVDSDGYVYVLDVYWHRIYKFEPAFQDESGKWKIGNQVGWLGKCTGNKSNQNGVEFNNCDVELQRSKGYSCTDLTCKSESDGAEIFSIQNVGTEPGQFNRPRSIEVDPNNVIYIADSGNKRVQRFGQQGTYAGQAKSTGSGINQGEERGFILGNMGIPRQLSVNSSAFYVMSPANENGDNFVHSFKTTPFSEVTDNSVKVKYIANSDAYNIEDIFTYVVDDGIEVSEPASVSVTISRNFRAPEKLKAQCFATVNLIEEIPCNLLEDTSVYLRLTAKDKDGFIGAGGLDTLTFSLIQDPFKGNLTEVASFSNSAVFLYEPDANVNGSDNFIFTVADQTLSSDEAKLVQLNVIPVPDPVDINAPDSMTVARGFPMSFTAEFDDIDRDEAPELIAIDWGDGGSSQSPDWENSGRLDTNKGPLSPQINAIPGKGLIVGGHTFTAKGDFNVVMQMQSIDPSLVETYLPMDEASIEVNVVESTMLNVVQSLPEAPVMPDIPFGIKFEISNLRPEGWSGLTAENVIVKLELPEGLILTELDNRCDSNGDGVLCVLGDLAVEQSEPFVFKGIVSLSQAIEEDIFELLVSTTTSSVNIQQNDFAVLTVVISDKDSDGIIDAEDDYPENADYQKDSDGDGLADSWEDKFGFNTSFADDLTSDTDGDGILLLDEFKNNGSPWRAEKWGLVAEQQISSEELTSEDRFGQIVRSADLNGDGIEDVIIGAPGHDTKGAVFISLGNPELGVSELIKIVPHESQTNFAEIAEFGKSITTGDFDDNGAIDLIIGSNLSAAIYYNNGEILSYPDAEISTPPSFMHSGDLDGDNIADLALTSTLTSSSGLVEIYLSSKGNLDDIQPLVFNSSSERFGQSIEIADIDADENMDLLVGSAFTTTGRVHVFLSSDNDWNTIQALTPSLILQGPENSSRFGFALSSGADIFGDGIDDLVIGAYGKGAYGKGAGQVFVYDSADQYWSVDNLGEIRDILPKQTILGEGQNPDPALFAGDQFGVSLSLDYLDSDENADLVVGANRTTSLDFGNTRIYTGSSAGLTPFQNSYSGEGAMDHYGYNVFIAGDVNGDGLKDILVGSPEFSKSSEDEVNTGHIQILLQDFIPIDESDDIDSDDVANQFDNCPDHKNTDQLNTDNDNFGNVCDADDDNDGVLDAADAFPLDASESVDTDGDGIGNNADTDDDGDGVLDVDDAYPLDPTRTRDDSAVVSKDVNGDGMADIFWRNQSDGRNWMWTMDGRSILTSAGINTIADPAWQIVGRGDFDGDGKSDILWRNSETGRNWVYLMDGFNIASSQQLNYVYDNNWHVKGVGDFDGDGKDDVIWRHAVRGDTWVYLMNGTQIRVSQGSRKVSDLNWKIVAVGDVDGDSQDDVIWRHATRGDNYIWLMSGVQLSSGYVLNRISTNWEITGAGDLNGDGTDDILWRNKVDGRNWGYLMNGGQIQTSQLINTVSSQDWQMADILDLDGDGKADIFWRNNNDGRSYIFLMNGLSIKSQGFSTSVSNNWFVMD